MDGCASARQTINQRHSYANQTITCNPSEELRALWSQPETRQGLLDGLQAKGYAAQQLRVISRAVNAERSDLFDVLRLQLQTARIHRVCVGTLC
jgi:hypothetical protein